MVGLGCGRLPDIAPLECGNGVVEPEIGEQCDLFPDDVLGEDLKCGDADDQPERRCRYLCDGGAACPVSWGCGRDGVCRIPSEDFAMRDAFRGVGPGRLWARDFDGDGRLDVGQAYGGEVHVHFGAGDEGAVSDRRYRLHQSPGTAGVPLVDAPPAEAFSLIRAEGLQRAGVNARRQLAAPTVRRALPDGTLAVLSMRTEQGGPRRIAAVQADGAGVSIHPLGVPVGVRRTEPVRQEDGRWAVGPRPAPATDELLFRSTAAPFRVARYTACGGDCFARAPDLAFEGRPELPPWSVDVDQDGDDDWVFLVDGPDGPAWAVVCRDGAAPLVPTPAGSAAAYCGDSTASCVHAVRDVDGDGRPDLVWRGGYASGVASGCDDLSFAPRYNSGEDWASAVAWSADGTRPGGVVALSTTSVSLWALQPSALDTVGVRSLVLPAPAQMLFRGDFNGDATSDVVVALDGPTPALHFVLGPIDGDSERITRPLDGVEAGTQFVVGALENADGMDDVALLSLDSAPSWAGLYGDPAGAAPVWSPWPEGPATASVEAVRHVRVDGDWVAYLHRSDGFFRASATGTTAYAAWRPASVCQLAPACARWATPLETPTDRIVVWGAADCEASPRLLEFSPASGRCRLIASDVPRAFTELYASDLDGDGDLEAVVLGADASDATLRLFDEHWEGLTVSLPDAAPMPGSAVAALQLKEYEPRALVWAIGREVHRVGVSANPDREQVYVAYSTPLLDVPADRLAVGDFNGDGLDDLALGVGDEVWLFETQEGALPPYGSGLSE